jgi:T5SS/PEP-CTERM-associated repeat protein
MNINTSGGVSPISHTGAATLGDTFTGIGIANLSGFGSDWTLTTATADMTVANNGTGSLNLSNLAFVSVPDDLFVAAQLGSLGKISISGLGTILNVADDTNIGQRGQAIVEIFNGGRLVTDQNIIGDEPAGDGRVTLSDQFSLWRASSFVVIADAGRGHMQVLDGARVENTSGQIGVLAGSSGIVEVAGAGSVWANSTNLQVGFSGNGSLVIADGGRVTAAGGLALTSIGDQLSGRGDVEVRGPGSLLSVGVLDVGNFGTGALRVFDGGRVLSTGPFIGNNAGARGTVLVDGVNSAWDVAGELNIADAAGAEGALTVSNGGRVTANPAVRNFAGGTITLDGGRLEILGATGLLNAGLVKGGGVIQGIVANNPGGQIRTSGPKPLVITGSLTNSGLLDVASGELETLGPTNNNLDIDARNGATLRFRGTGLDNNSGSQLAITSGNVDVFGLVTNDLGAEIVVGGTALGVFHDAVTNNGTIFVQPGGKVLMLENLAFSPSAALSLPLQAPAPGAAPARALGQIDVAGPVQLAGGLDVRLFGDEVPLPGDRFRFLTSDSVTGTFASATIAGPPGSGVQFHPIYTATDVSLFVAGAGHKTWGIDADGRASLASNWLGGVAPGAIDDKVAFTTIISANRGVGVDAPFTAGSLYFDDDNDYLIQGPGAITLDVSAGDARIDVKNFHGAGQHTIAAPLSLSDNTTIDVAAGSLLTITSQMTADKGVALTKSGAGPLMVKNVRAAGLAVNEGIIQVLNNGGNDGVSVVNALTIAKDAKFDLTDNSLVFDYDAPTSPLLEVRSQVVSGAITSSTAAANPSRAVGYGESATILGPGGGTFMGQTVDGTAVLVRTTLKGDTNLDGAVNFNDLARLAQNYNIVDGNRLWDQGDFTYDGNVDFNDLAAMAQNYNTSLPATLPGSAAFQDDLARAFAQVPEPAAAGVLAFLVCTISVRIRRQAPCSANSCTAISSPSHLRPVNSPSR